MIAVRAGHMDIVQQLTSHSEVDLQDQYGFTCVHYATISRQKDILKYLISETSGCDDTVQGRNHSSGHGERVKI